MKLTILVKIVSALCLCAFFCSSCSTDSDFTEGFVKIDNGRFVIDGKPYYYVGTNFWYGAILGSQGKGGNRERLLKELDTMKANGINNLRVLVGADGMDAIDTKVEPALQLAPDVYNDTIFDGLDFFLAELGKRQMYAVLFLNNSWEWSGGYAQYLNWSGYGEVPMPKVAGWNAFTNYVAQYAKADSAHVLFQKHIRNVLGRTNSYTKKKYCDDPAIMAWQIANEPRPFGEDNKLYFKKWIAESAALIKSLDPNHLVSVGSEGSAGCEGDIKLWNELHQDPNVDYATIHIWPNNWGWIDKSDIEGTLDAAISNTCSYVDLHVSEMQKLDKPLVIEEFGLPRDGVKFERYTSVNLRNKYYSVIFDMVKNNASCGGLLQGCNFWAWGGMANPTHLFWQDGDDYMGDPGQEEQGLNSVYDTDPTLGLISNVVDEISQMQSAGR